MGSDDPYLEITRLADEEIDRIAERLELRAAAREQREMCERYLSDLELSNDSQVLEVGCGTGAVARRIASRPEVAAVRGLDPSVRLLDHARRLAGGVSKLEFDQGDAHRLPYADGSFAAVVFHTTLCHIRDPLAALAEARRVLGPSGRVAVFDADCPTATVAVAAGDPLQCAVHAWVDALHHDPWLVRRMPYLLGEAGFDLLSARSHGYLELAPAEYLVTVVDRGTRALHDRGSITAEGADAFRAESRRRVAAGSFYGHIAYTSFVAQRR